MDKVIADRHRVGGAVLYEQSEYQQIVYWRGMYWGMEEEWDWSLPKRNYLSRVRAVFNNWRMGLQK